MPIDVNLARIVYEDLHYLSQEWNQDIDEPSLRRASPTLRRLLVEGQGLVYIAHVMNRELMIVAPTVTIPRLDGIAFFSVGGAMTKMGSMTGGGLLFGSAAINERLKPLIGEHVPMKLANFLKQTCLVLSDVEINREEIIKYVAHKLGGVHYDASRNQEKNLEKKYALMDEVHTGAIRSTKMGKNIVYYELLSTGQYLVNSPDIAQFMMDVRQLLD